ncbi:MAG: uracil-DNA glycosylase [Bacillota bacterium]|nr:uracil-DNA glycosylase [Bacillota bacterium]
MRERYLFEMIVPGSEKETRRPAPVYAQDPPKQDGLKELAGEARQCSRCSLRSQAQQVVFGEGNPAADLMFVGEGPGAAEDEQGLPFVGEAGQLLNKILAAAQIRREEVYIANVVKCRPPENRTPQKEEVESCLPYLLRQIDCVRPRIIVCLGALATQALLGGEARVTKVRGRWHNREGIQVMPTFHPAALLRDPAKKKPVWEDIQKVRDAYRLLK